MTPTSERRRSPRVSVQMECTLHRRSGSPIAARTVDLGPGGMSVACKRPLAADEELRFELPPRISGRARVLRQQGFETYAVRFEALGAPEREELEGLVAFSR
jgi:c-di-GMP-binding flagellar brake protein YcgR